MLTTVVSLQIQVVLFIVGHLEEFPIRFLALLPHVIRKWLFLHLPIADICRLEFTALSVGVDMGEVWRARMQTNIQNANLKSDNFWRQRFLQHMWDMAMMEPSGYWLHSYLQSPRGLLRNRCHCQWHYTEKGLFGLVNGEMDISNLYKINGKGDFTLNAISRLVSYRCAACLTLFHVPCRYIKCMVKEYNLISLISMFYTYCDFRPHSITLCHHNMYKRASPLAQKILLQYPAVLNELVGRTKFLKLLPLYLEPKYSKKSQTDNYNAIINCLHVSLQSSLEELDIQLLISPFEPSKVKKPFRSLKFLSIKSLQNSILDRSYAHHLISLHSPTLKVVKIAQCTFRSSNLSTLTELFRSSQFSVMMFSNSVFLIDTFQMILYNFLTNGQNHQVLSFKASLLEGSDTFKQPIVGRHRLHNSSPCCRSTLSIEDIRVAFHSIRALQSSMKRFPEVYLNRLNLKGMRAIEISSYLPYIEANQLCLSISTALEKRNIITLKGLLSQNVFNGISLCLKQNFLAETSFELIQEFSEYIIEPIVCLQSVKLSWMGLEDGQHNHHTGNVAEVTSAPTSTVLYLLNTIVNHSKSEMSELDMSEYYSTNPSVGDILLEVWRKNKGKQRLAKVVVGREAVTEHFDLEQLAEVVIEKSTTCEL